jgi:hypothetical protein
LTNLFEEGKILHIPRPNLHDIGIRLHQINMRRIHDLRNNRQTCILTGLYQELQTFLLHSLETVWRRSRFKRPASEEVSPSLFNNIGAFQHLLLAFNRARTSHDNKPGAANLHIAYGNNGIFLP